MTTDLVSLCVLVVSAFRPVRETWRRGAALASVPIDFVEGDGPEARTRLAKGGVDIVVLDAALSDADREGAIKASRAAKPPPFILVAAPAGSARFEGVDAIVAKPADDEAARAAVERCIRARLPQRVLIVDDSGTMRSIVRKILSASRYALDLSEAEEGIAALQKLKDGMVDIVLLDYNMPGFNGLETLAEIKRTAPRVMVVMMSSTMDSAVAEKAQAAGATFLKKPFYPADIDATLDKLYGFAR